MIGGFSTSVRKEALCRLGSQGNMFQALKLNPPVSDDPINGRSWPISRDLRQVLTP